MDPEQVRNEVWGADSRPGAEDLQKVPRSADRERGWPICPLRTPLNESHQGVISILTDFPHMHSPYCPQTPQ